MKAAIKNHRLLLTVGAALAVLVAFGGLAAFQPWKLWVDQKVEESAPVVAPANGAAAPSAPSAPSAGRGRPTGPKQLFSTDAWLSVSHGSTTGRVRVFQQPDGSRVLRLENLDTSNGPDLKVVLSKGDYRAQGDLTPGYLNLGTLKGNKGSSNYTIAADVDLNAYKSAVIWCKRFDAVFAAAPIST
ncbi:DM13 domain-containing protein [Spirillospora sp. NPDC047279]|uniref:DM13 domain-containing protein n=1 Tax=Spirillospora sp. NPDC047279 TaxID=3155478 RepID=UPI0033DE75E7